MSFHHNQVQLIGRAGHTPDLHTLTDGTLIARLRLYQNPGPDPTVAESFRLVAWGALAQRLCHMVRRGDRLLIQGRLRNRSFRRDEVVHLRTEVHLDAFFPLARQITALTPEPQAL